MKKLRSGYTTGTCAAAAAKAAALLLVGRDVTKDVEITLPGGDIVRMPVVYGKIENGCAEASVRKDAGDDPDITNGVLVVASVAWVEGGDVILEAGEGVGIVTKPGLQVAPGEPAINPFPRRMIREAVRAVTDRGVRVTLSIPCGRELAAKTFNPRLGITGGLSILGTSGRVRPFSCPALKTSLKCLLDVAVATGIKNPVFVPGRIGRRAAERHFLVKDSQVIEVGNDWGFMVDMLAPTGTEALLVVGHPGKLAKLAMDEWDTHSSRSASAVPFIVHLAESIFRRSLPESPTVEGIFTAFGNDERKKLGDRLATLIRKAVSGRIGGGIAVSIVLVDMKGDMIGKSGNFTVWK